MGKFIWHEYARYVSLTASVYTIWAAFWGFFYRKFFWDFVGGILRAPGGLQPSAGSAIFITLIVKMPIIQILAMLSALTIIALDFPFPFLKGTALQRNLVIRVVLLAFQIFLCILFYQGTNGAIWSFVAWVCYTKAVVAGEQMAVAVDNKGGKGGRA